MSLFSLLTFCVCCCSFFFFSFRSASKEGEEKNYSKWEINYVAVAKTMVLWVCELISLQQIIVPWLGNITTCVSFNIGKWAKRQEKERKTIYESLFWLFVLDLIWFHLFVCYDMLCVCVCTVHVDGMWCNINWCACLNMAWCIFSLTFSSSFFLFKCDCWLWIAENQLLENDFLLETNSSAIKKDNCKPGVSLSSFDDCRA